MENKSDVKAIMARFNTGGNSTESVPGGRPKKPVLENSLSGSAALSSTMPKPNVLKSTVSTKSAPEVREFPKPKPKFGTAQEEAKPPVTKQPLFKPKPPEPPRDADPKPPFPKPPLQKPTLSATLSDSKPPIVKPPPATAKPSWVKDATKSEEGGGNNAPTPPKFPLAPKPKSAVTALRSQAEEGSAGDSAARPFPVTPLKPTGFRAAQSMFNKESFDSQGEEGNKDRVKPLNSNDSSVPKTAIAHKTSFMKRQLEQKENSNPNVPKRNPLPNKLALGTPPAKPNRPPVVNLEKFQKGGESTTDGALLKKGTPPPPPASHPSNHVAPPLPSHPAAPSLPPRPSGAIIQPDPDENYDDVGVMNHPPPLPAGGHPSQKAEEAGSDDEMYEDLEDRWSTMESKEQEKKREKEEKKRIEQEKKEQKEREKKEQEVRKKFKLSGPIQVIHKVKAKIDYKGGKNDLSLKQDEPIEIIRISDNPEGRWLGRTRDGSYGYVKTDSVEIDFDTLKRKGEALPIQAEEDQELYDDIAVQDDFSSVKGPGVILPPPPEEDGDIYDDLDDPDLNVSPSATEVKSPLKPRGFLKMFKSWDEWRKPASNNEVPPPPQFTPEGHTDKQQEPIDEEIYDDVDSQSFPTPPSLSSLPQVKPKGKMEDPKKQKKFEKEEKEFRKKFKYDGEIQTLYQVTIISTLTNKKWGSKDLPLRPGEVVDVIVKPVDNKLIGRNDEGKFGYVSTSNIVAEDADIYDDIGEDCIYDND
ncbi:hypothetical protein AGOR_G00246250 [Albula goreensis]|uniref:FYN-binding protein 1 n=1 Tax=Albula goreensis TaxID=1534307 RepID=A0A8T3CGX4_9TELE|nr:hypothetical protein AGOR_G00246250 [Albula goreensis]